MPPTPGSNSSSALVPLIMAETEQAPPLVIPITSGSDSSLFVEIFPEEIKDVPVSNLLKLLTNESPVSPQLWADAALLYMQRKRKRESLTILEAACQEGKDARVLAATGIAHLAVPSDEQKVNQDLADQRFSQAAGTDTFFPMTWMGRGMLGLKSGRPEQAKFFFETTLKERGQVLPGLLGMAAVFYGQKKFSEAQAKYAEAIRRYPVESGAASRVGFAFACYQQGQVDRAKAAFDRALAIDPENVEAMVGSAILDMAGGTTEQAIKRMSMANLLDHSNAMVQNHLANHYFWKWTNLTGMVAMKNGSDICSASQPMSLDVGDPVRIGNTFEAQITQIMDDEEDETGTRYKLSKTWRTNDAASLKVWKKDYERVFALAKGAYSSTKVSEIQAESLFFLARVYHMREESEALKFYEKSCKLAPKFAPARFGLAQMLVVKEQYDEAAKQLRLLLTQSSHATDAFALLGLLEIRSGKVVEGLGHLRKAIDLDPSNPDMVALEALALQQHRTNYGKALERYKNAVDLITRRGESVAFQIYANCGVLCHETKKYEESLDMYKKALEVLDASGDLHQVSLANTGVDGVRIVREENNMFNGFVDANVEFVAVSPTEFKIPGLTNAGDFPCSAGQPIRLNDTFHSVVTKVDVNDDAVVVEIKEPYDPMVENEATGVGVIKAFVSRENKLLESEEVVTVAFNIARVHEASGKTLAAIELHKAIAKRYPAYVNCYLRLACIAVDSGSLNECAQWLKIAAGAAPGNSEVLTLIGNLHLSLSDWKPAQKVFEGLMSQKIPSVEAYAALSMGNIFFANLHVSQDRYGKHLQYAADYYKKILTKDPNNAYAANGIGTILAEKGKITEAREVFTRVREVSGDQLNDALLNLGHVFLAQKKHSEALQLYQNYMKRAEDGTTPLTSKSQIEDIVDVLLYIAFAYFDWARFTEMQNDSTAAPADGMYKKAMDHLTLAIEKRSKKETILKYNLCMTKLQAANCCLHRLTRNIPRTVADVQEALSGLEESLTVVMQILKDKEEGKKVNIKTTILEDFIKLCNENVTSARSHLEDEKVRAEEEAREKELRRLASEALHREAELQEAIRKEEEARKQEEQERKAEEKMRKVDELKEGWQHDNDMEKDKVKSKKKSVALAPAVDDADDNAGTAAGLFDSDEESDDGKSAVAAKVTAPQETATKSELFGSDSDSEDDDDEADADDASKGEAEPKSAESAANNDADNAKKDSLFDSDGDSDEELVPAAAAGSKRTLEDSSDDEDTAKKQKTD